MKAFQKHLSLKSAESLGLSNFWPYKDYSKDEEDEILGQYKDGNYLKDSDGNVITDVDTAIDTYIPKSDSWFSGITDFFNNIGGSLGSILSMISSVFGSLKKLPDEELFNQGYSWLNKETGANLTGAELQQNQFNAEQAAIQRGWEERMSNTAYQRAVSDMTTAGINPALMYGNGASGSSTPSGSAASGSAAVLPSQLLNLILGIKQLKMQDLMSKRQNATSLAVQDIASKTSLSVAEMQADVKKHELDLQDKWKTREGDQKDRELTMQEKESLSRIANYEASAYLSRTSAEQQEVLRDSLISLNEARSFEARQHAASLAVERAMNQGLLDLGWCSKTIRAMDASLTQEEAQAAAVQYHNDLKTGKMKFYDKDGNVRTDWRAKLASEALGALATVGEALHLNMSLGAFVGSNSSRSFSYNRSQGNYNTHSETRSENRNYNTNETVNSSHTPIRGF